MLAKVRFNLGGTEYIFEIDGEKEMETLNKIIVLGNPPRFCDVCKNTNFFKFDSNKDKEGNTYVNVICCAKGCYAKAKLGQYKTGGYFWHRFEKYVKNGSTTAQAEAE